VKVWEPEQLGELHDAIAADNDRLHPLFHLAAFAGLRRGELCGLRWQDVDLDKRIIDVTWHRTTAGHRVIESTPKTECAESRVDIDQRTAELLKRHRKNQIEERLAWGPAWHDTGLVFTRERRGPTPGLRQLSLREARRAPRPSEDHPPQTEAPRLEPPDRRRRRHRHHQQAATAQLDQDHERHVRPHDRPRNGSRGGSIVDLLASILHLCTAQMGPNVDEEAGTTARSTRGDTMRPSRPVQRAHNSGNPTCPTPATCEQLLGRQAAEAAAALVPLKGLA
jgi:hypothetical protein